MSSWVVMNLIKGTVGKAVLTARTLTSLASDRQKQLNNHGIKQPFWEWKFRGQRVKTVCSITYMYVVFYNSLRMINEVAEHLLYAIASL